MFERTQYKELGLVFLVLAVLVIFSRVFVRDSAEIAMFHNLLWAISLSGFAMSRGRHPAWGLLGFAFGLFGYISLFFLKEIPKKNT